MFAVVEVGGQSNTTGRVLVTVPGVVVGLLALIPVRAAVALLKNRADAPRRARATRRGYLFPMLGLTAFGAAAFVRTLVNGEPITQVLPFIAILLAVSGLVVVGVRLAGGSGPPGPSA